jgi:hypothetical protein
MHSSTSNSDNECVSRAYRWPIVTLLVILLSGAAALEAATRRSIYEISVDLGRIHQESTNASRIQKTVGQAKLLLVGNSLLLLGVDTRQLNSELLPRRISVSRYAIQQTSFYDWYFGLQRLLSEGAQPDVVLLALEPRNILESGVRNDFFAHYLMRLRDLPRVREALHLDLTTTSDLLFCNISTFYALRRELRKNLLVRILPELPSLTSLIVRTRHPPADLHELATTGRSRLSELNETILAIAPGTAVAVIVMPPVSADQALALMDVGGKIGIRVMVPLSGGDLSPSDFQSDGYHLSDQGKYRFTQSLAQMLSFH